MCAMLFHADHPLCKVHFQFIPSRSALLEPPKADLLSTAPWQDWGTRWESGTGTGQEAQAGYCKEFLHGKGGQGLDVPTPGGVQAILEVALSAGARWGSGLADFGGLFQLKWFLNSITLLTSSCSNVFIPVLLFLFMSESPHWVSVLPVPFSLQGFQFLCALFTGIWKSKIQDVLQPQHSIPCAQGLPFCGIRTTFGEAFIINTNKEMFFYRFTSGFLPQSIIKITRGQKPFNEFHVEKQQNTIKYQAPSGFAKHMRRFRWPMCISQSKCEQETQNCSPTEQNFSLEGLFILKMWH